MYIQWNNIPVQFEVAQLVVMTLNFSVMQS